MRAVFRRLVQLVAGDRPAVLAVVTRVQGSAYRGPGALVLIEPDGTLCGNVTGGCLEEDLKERAREALQRRRCLRVRYDTGGEDQLWGLGIGCEGTIHLFLRPFPRDGDRDLLRWLLSRLEAGEECAVGIVLEKGPREGELLAAGPREARPGPGSSAATAAAALQEAFAELRTGETTLAGTPLMILKAPRPRDLVIIGAGDDAIPLVRYAFDTGFRVFVVDHRPAYLTAERFPGAERLIVARYDDPAFSLTVGPETCVVVKTRLLEHDRGWVQRLAGLPAYLGLLGPAHRRERVTEGLAAAKKQRIYGPVGLDIGAVGPEQIAISIIAEILAVLSGSSGGHARDRKGPLHRR